MVTEILISTGNYEKHLKKDIQDLRKVHEIRGRIIHYMSIIERIMKNYCGQTSTNKTYGQIKDLFIQKLTENHLNNTSDFYEFVKALNQLNPNRNSWAHGLVFFEKRDQANEPKNSILMNNQKTSVVHPYFEDHWNKPISIVISWLKKNNLFNINRYVLREEIK